MIIAAAQDFPWHHTPIFAVVAGVVVLIAIAARSRRELAQTNLKLCKSCGTSHPDFACFCRKCGRNLST